MAISDFEYARAKRILADNPKMSLAEFKELTGLSWRIYYQIKHELNLPHGNTKNKNFNSELKDIALKIELKRKLKIELLNSLKKSGLHKCKRNLFRKDVK